MAQTMLMRADEIAHSFNSVAERKYWRASVAGSRYAPEVHFNSRASMVRVAYRIATSDFTVTFNRANAAFGDFLASTYRSIEQVLASLKAAGLPFSEALGEDAVLRIQYHPRSRDLVIHIAQHGDNWPEAEPIPFKVPDRKVPGSDILTLDGI